jgi:hypothetical protein
VGKQIFQQYTKCVGIFHCTKGPFFAAPVVGASPDNIGAQRLAEGGVPTGGAGSATNQAEKNWNLTPIKSRPTAEYFCCAFLSQDHGR